MIKTWVLILWFLLLVPSALFAQISRPGTMPGAGETRYFLRLLNCDDKCDAGLINGGGASASDRFQRSSKIVWTDFGKDTGWIDFTDALQPGVNKIGFWLFNYEGAIAYGFQIKKNERLVFEQICGRAGTLGCDNNRVFPQGLTKEFTYEIAVARPVAYERWLVFYAAFRAAVNAKDRQALRTMISSSYDCGGTCTVAQVMKGLDLNRGRSWQSLQKSLAWGTNPNGLSPRSLAWRATKDGRCVFEFEADGRWRWSGEEVGD